MNNSNSTVMKSIIYQEQVRLSHRCKTVRHPQINEHAAHLNQTKNKNDMITLTGTKTAFDKIQRLFMMKL